MRISCFRARHSEWRAEWRRRLSECSWVEEEEVLEVGGEEDDDEEKEGEGRERQKGFKGA